MDRKAQPETRGISPVQQLVLASAGERRDHAKHVFMLDNECAHIARQTHEPMMAQIRLAWWRDGLRAENLLPEHRNELMENLRGNALFGQSREALIAIIDGWEELIRIIDDRHHRFIKKRRKQGASIDHLKHPATS